MRKQFVRTVEEVLSNDKKSVLLLGDIGVFGFRNSLLKYPDRVYNIGILEQSTISLAAGLAMHDFVPIVHTIAPFIVERALEQIKDDFGYQKLGGNFVSVGSSYDYAALGCTHHCPGDVGILKNVPEIEIVVPGHPEEFDRLFKQSYDNGRPTYFRLSENSNGESLKVKFGKANIVKRGKKATIIAVGPMLENVLRACRDLDVTILYYTTLNPFDSDTLKNNASSGTVIVCEPYYSGALDYDITEALAGRNTKIFHIGIKREFIRQFGKKEEIDELLGLTSENMENRIKKLIKS